MTENKHTSAGVMDRGQHRGPEPDECHRPLGVRDDRCEGT